MIKKRVIGTIIVRDGWAVQSFSYKNYLPIGKPRCLVENLDRWGADEIIILSIDRSRHKLGPDIKTLKDIAAEGIKTPLIYGGGIFDAETANEVIRCGADRIVLDNMFHNGDKKELLKYQIV